MLLLLGRELRGDRTAELETRRAMAQPMGSRARSDDVSDGRMDGERQDSQWGPRCTGMVSAVVFGVTTVMEIKEMQTGLKQQWQ